MVFKILITLQVFAVCIGIAVAVSLIKLAHFVITQPEAVNEWFNKLTTG
jgi:hypothetical protein